MMPSRDDGYRITRYKNGDGESLALVEWLGGFAQGKLDAATQIWEFMVVEPEEFPELRSAPMCGFQHVTRQVMDRPESDRDLVYAIRTSRGHLARRKVTG